MLSRSAAQAPHRAASFAALSKLTYPKLGRIFDAAIFLKCWGVSVSYLIVIGSLMPRVVYSFSKSSPDWLLDRRLWILLAMSILCPLAFLRKLDSLKVTSYISLCAVGNLVSIRFLIMHRSKSDMSAALCCGVQIMHQLVGTAFTRSSAYGCLGTQVCPESTSTGKPFQRQLWCHVIDCCSVTCRSLLSLALKVSLNPALTQFGLTSGYLNQIYLPCATSSGRIPRPG